MNYIISFPRSGQHLVVSMLEYLTNKFSLDFSYCDYYNCCNAIPCKEGHLFQKNHDFWTDPYDTKFNLNKIEKNSDDKYLVLYRRDAIKQLEAYYRGWFNLENIKNPRLRLVYDYDELLDFITHNIDYYKNFIEKWVNDKSENILSIEYYDLVNDPDFYCEKIIKHFYDIEIESDIKDQTIEVKDYGKYKKYGKIEIQNQMDINIYNRLKSELNIKI